MGNVFEIVGKVQASEEEAPDVIDFSPEEEGRISNALEALRDAERYDILREYVAPADLHEKMQRNGLDPGDWHNLDPNEYITDRIDQLCDFAILKKREGK
jgi:hypothetical protein